MRQAYVPAPITRAGEQQLGAQNRRTPGQFLQLPGHSRPLVTYLNLLPPTAPAYSVTIYCYNLLANCHEVTVPPHARRWLRHC